ncbi:UDP:flavonoid glycosyltransferase YjiC (YdhE family) [Desulfobotulus alkaliphilus]|uniref:UDP:flavonoid glycosyltransferase YjiC (YdhE family) n=1 Tax=Desulfobotulus alkaliphilus TaxID=622671 RepID=A0A562RTA3_9BACT|nr:glycosyltransferase [Desulfobotulus alkaliphilus]TWI72278.1 UDP:flavonoid glycosyltransferase YjiC (YdhE family) [Desulfobotulus alkaliphilus]
MRCILIPVGSHGDVHPLLGLGVHLQEEGHEVIVCTCGYFRELVEKCGLRFEEVGTAEDYLDLIASPDLWNPLKSYTYMFRKTGKALMQTQFETISRLHEPGKTLLISSYLAMGARIAQEKLGLPLISVIYQPAALWSIHDTPRYFGMLTGPSVPKFLKRLQGWLLLDGLIGAVIAPPLNRYRKSLGLAPVRKVDQWLLSNSFVLAAFPKWFAPAQPDWPRHILHIGFPMWDGMGEKNLPPEVEDFLAQGEAPLVFTPGTANMHAVRFFESARDACVMLGKRAVFLTRFPQQLPENLPASILCHSYLPLSLLLPRATALVHHGGIGTASQAFRAGIPQLIMPMSFDQHDNAERVRRLGAGAFLSPGRFTAPRLAGLLRRICQDLKIRQNCREISLAMQGENAFTCARRALEMLGENAGAVL